MFRKRRQATPDFKLPSPYQPLTGEQAPLQMQGVFPYVAMMQVAAEDTERDYVLCRGFDVRIARFIDYEDGNANKPGIPVAKPYGKRHVGAYEVAQIFPAILPLQTNNPSPVSVPWRVGQNPGVATVATGHPTDLAEKVDFLKDANDAFINWMLLDGGGETEQLVECCLAEDHPGYGAIFTVKLMVWDPEKNGHKPDPNSTGTYYAIDWRYGMPSYPGAGARGLFIKRRGYCDGAYVDMYEVVSLDCEVPPIACSEAEEAECTSY
jgi:hypothetical protein